MIFIFFQFSLVLNLNDNHVFFKRTRLRSASPANDTLSIIMFQLKQTALDSTIKSTDKVPFSVSSYFVWKK